jgi:hypothetical protein
MAKHGAIPGTLVRNERTSRALIGSRLTSKQAEPVARTIQDALAPLQ